VISQPGFDFAAPARPKKRGHVPKSSVAAYRERPRDKRVSAVVLAFQLVDGPSTSAELTRAMCYEDGVRAELSKLLAVRRGLSDALALGLVSHAGERKCAVSGRKCVTWMVRSR
jgi:hypothetical protein